MGEEEEGRGNTVRFWKSQARNLVMASLLNTLGTLRFPFGLLWSESTDSRPSSLEPQMDSDSSPAARGPQRSAGEEVCETDKRSNEKRTGKAGRTGRDETGHGP